jgi:putative transposase
MFVFVILAHQRRRVVHVNVTDAPTAQWTGQQLVEACPWETAPRYLLRDRDGVYGVEFSNRVRGMGIGDVKTAPRSPCGIVEIPMVGGLHHRYTRQAA